MQTVPVRRRFKQTSHAKTLQGADAHLLEEEEETLSDLLKTFRLIKRDGPLRERGGATNNAEKQTVLERGEPGGL